MFVLSCMLPHEVCPSMTTHLERRFADIKLRQGSRQMSPECELILPQSRRAPCVRLACSGVCFLQYWDPVRDSSRIFGSKQANLSVRDDICVPCCGCLFLQLAPPPDAPVAKLGGGASENRKLGLRGGCFASQCGQGLLGICRSALQSPL